MYIYDCVVIGGGISGISFAYELTKVRESVCVLEKGKKNGGQIQTYHSELYPDFWVELGAHTCYNTYMYLLSIVKGLRNQDQLDMRYTGASFRELPLSAWLQPLQSCPYVLYRDGKIRNVLSQIHYPSLFFHGPRLFFSSKKDKTVRDYFRPMVGGANYDRLFSKMFRAVLSQKADDYPAELFLKKRDYRVKEAPRKFSIRGGLQTCVDSMQANGRVFVRHNSEAVEIKKEAGHYRILLADGDIFEAVNVAFATPVDVTAKFLRTIEPEVAECLRTIPTFHSESLNVIVKKERLSHLREVAGIIPVSDEFLSIVSRDAVEHPEVRSFTIHFEGHQKTEDEKKELLCRVLSIQPEDILESVSSSHVLPSLRLQHADLVRKVHEMRTQDDIFLLGNYYYGLSLEDCVHRSVNEALRYRKSPSYYI